MRKKILLMGKGGAGKTSMRAIIFSNLPAAETRRLGATMEIEHSTVHFIGDLNLNIWDCGGQTRFMNDYINEQKDIVFSDVEVLIYVFDIESRDQESEFRYYKQCLTSLLECSPTAKIFCLIHKIDLVKPELQSVILEKYKAELEPLTKPFRAEYFATTIWNYTLYRAWSRIAYKLVPNIEIIDSKLQGFCASSGAVEVVMFERSTFLVVSHTRNQENITENDSEGLHEKYVKISESIKCYRQACSALRAPFESVHIKNGEFSIFLEPFTKSTYILVVLQDTDIEVAMVKLNIELARSHFADFADTHLNS